MCIFIDDENVSIVALRYQPLQSVVSRSRASGFNLSSQKNPMITKSNPFHPESNAHPSLSFVCCIRWALASEITTFSAMYKPALRIVPRYALPSRSVLRNSSTSRFLSTAPPVQKRRSWTNSAVRWGLAIGAVYVYSTSTVFAEEPECAFPYPSSMPGH